MPELVEVQIRPGMSEAIDPRLLPMGTPRLIQNIRFRPGRFEKRPGSQALATAGLPGVAHGLWVTEHSGRAIVALETSEVSGNHTQAIYSLGDAETRWRFLGRYGPVVPERRFSLSIDLGDTGKDHTIATVNGILFVAYTESAGGGIVHLHAVDPNGIMLDEVVVQNAACPRLVYANSVLYLVTRDTSGAGDNVDVRIVPTTNLSLLASPALTFTSLLATGATQFDAMPVAGSTTWALAYPVTITAVAVKRLNGLTNLYTEAETTTALPTQVGLNAVNGELYAVGYCDGADLKVTFFDSTSVASPATYTIATEAGSESFQHQVGIARVGVNQVHVVCGGSDSDASPTLNTNFIVHARIDSGGSMIGGTAKKAPHYQPASKPWTVGGDQCLLWAHNRNSTSFWTGQASHYIVELKANASDGGGGINLASTSFEHIATYGASVNFKDHLPEVATLGSDGLRATLLPWSDPGQFSGLDVAVWRSAVHTDSHRYAHRAPVSVGGALYVPGGCLYDVSEASGSFTHYVCENGFPYDPEIAVQALAGGSMTSGQLYTYTATYCWLDSLGRVHESAPAAPKTITPSGGNLSTTIRIATLNGTGKLGTYSNAPFARIYRATLGGPFRLVTTTGSVAPTLGALSITATDGDSDATASAALPLYTELGHRANEPPSGARLMAWGPSRLATVGWNERSVQFSKLWVSTAPIEFCDDNQWRSEPLPQRITAIRWLDGALVVFTANGIYLIEGDGPDDQGVGFFSSPRPLPSTIGCDDPRSLVEIPQGLIFQSAGTLYILPRGFGPPMPFGDDVGETLEALPFIDGACLATSDAQLCHVALSSADTGTPTQKVLVYDTTHQGWAVDTITGYGGIGIVDGDLWWILSSWDSLNDLPVRRLSSASNQDLAVNNGTATWIESRIGFGDIRPYGALGWGTVQRVLVHGETVGTCRVGISYAVNGASPASVLKDRSATGVWNLELLMPTRQGNAFRYDVYDSELVGTTAGAAFHVLALEIEPQGKAGAKTAPAERW